MLLTCIALCTMTQLNKKCTLCILLGAHFIFVDQLVLFLATRWTWSPIIIILSALFWFLPDLMGNIWLFYAHQLVTNFGCRPFYAGKAVFLWVFKAFSLKTAACYVWRWKLWELAYTVQLQAREPKQWPERRYQALQRWGKGGFLM